MHNPGRERRHNTNHRKSNFIPLQLEGMPFFLLTAKAKRSNSNTTGHECSSE